jgi:hypothetical protein
LALVLMFGAVPSTAVVVSAKAAGALTLKEQLTRETPPDLSYLDPYRLDQVTLAGGHNTYQKKGYGNDEIRNDIDGNFNLLYDSLRYTQTVELDVWNIAGHWFVSHNAPQIKKSFPFVTLHNNDNNCPLGGVIGANRNQDLYSCLEGLKGWQDRHPQHPLVIVKLEMKNGFNGNSPADLDSVINSSDVGLSPYLFRPEDLMHCDPQTSGCTKDFGSPQAAAQAHNWPTMKQLQGKFMFVMISGEFAMQNPYNMSPPASSIYLNLVDYFGHDDAPLSYAQALDVGTAHDIFPSLLMKEAPANIDPRTVNCNNKPPVGLDLPCGPVLPGYGQFGEQTTFISPEWARWDVVFDMESGYLPPPFGTGAISADRMQWIRQNNFLSFVSLDLAAPPCGKGNATCLQTLLNQMCPPGPTQQNCDNQWTQDIGADHQVDLTAGREKAQLLAATYKVNVIHTDQERLGLVDPQPIAQSETKSGWDPIDNTIGVQYPATATWGGGHVEMFGLSTNQASDRTVVPGQLYQRSFGPSGWTPWALVSTPFPVSTQPAVVAFSTGDLMVFVQNRLNAELYVGSFHQHRLVNWVPLGSAQFGPALSAVMLFNGNIDLYAFRQLDDSLQHTLITPAIVFHQVIGPQSIGPWQNLGGPTGDSASANAPAAIVNVGLQWRVFVRGTDGQIYGRNAAALLTQVWGNWYPVGTPSDATRYSPAATTWDGDIQNNVTLWTTTEALHPSTATLQSLTPAATSWSDRPDLMVGPFGPLSVLSSPDGYVDVYVTGITGPIYHLHYDPRL